jgi:phenylpropionate dioxygenase-like ring-hydroxylating dioxygenase large terminal subunit
MQETSQQLMQRLAAKTRVGYSFDQEFYASEAVFKADMEQIISRKWLLAGHASRIPNKGDYFLFRVGPEQIIVIRENEASVRAFFNVCRHRGSTICQADAGNAPKLVCPYHAWTFGLDGKLLAARLMPEDFDKAENSLFACHVRVFHGLIFINMSEGEPDDFDATFGDLGPILDYHGLAQARIAHAGRREFLRMLSLCPFAPRILLDACSGIDCCGGGRAKLGTRRCRRQLHA